MFTGIGLVAFCCIFGAGTLGLLLGGLLPEDHRSDDTKDAVKTAMNVVAILSALVLGLLIAGAKTNFETRSREVEEFSANLTLLDRELMHFGQDAKASRDELRAFTMRKLALTWPPDRTVEPAMHDLQAVQLLDDIQARLRAWAPPAEAEREGRVEALRLIGELKRTSRLLAVQQSTETPRAFLAIVVFWLSVLFVSFAIFAPLNWTVVGAMLICAVSVSMAVNVIFDMDRPFQGYVRISSMPMRQALDQMIP